MRWEIVEFVSKHPHMKTTTSTLDGKFSICYSGKNSWLVKNNAGFRDDFIVCNLKEAKRTVLDKLLVMGWRVDPSWIPIRWQCGFWSIQRLKNGYSVSNQNKCLSNHSNLREAKNYVEVFRNGLAN